MVMTGVTTMKLRLVHAIISEGYNVGNGLATALF
jgi:hypothetical protein